MRKAWRSGSLRVTVCGGPNEASATVAATSSLSCLAALLETGLWGTEAAAISSSAAGML